MKRINPYRLFIGAFLPNWLLVQPEISAMAKIVYARLAQFAGKHGFAHPKQPTLAASVGCPVRNLQRYIDELKQYKLIESVQQGLGKANIYYFLWHPWMEEGTELTAEDIDALNSELTPLTPEMAEQVTPSMALPVTPSMAQPLKGGRESVEDKTDTPPPPSQGESAQEVSQRIRRAKLPREHPDYDPEGFTRFYQPYPKHKNLQDAMNAWDVIRPPPELRELIIANVEARARGDPEWLKEGGKYAPGPGVYLRNARWTDEWKPHQRSTQMVEN